MPAAVCLRTAAVAVPNPGFSTTFRIGLVTLLTFAAVVTISPTSAQAADVVLDAASGTRAGAFIVVNDSAAAGGTAAALPNKARAKVVTAVAAPADYLELTFTADANTPYHLWVRMRAETNSYANDSFHVQFTNVATGAIGTTSSQVVNLEDASKLGVAAYGWQDNGYGAGVLGPDIVFSRAGTQRLRIQNREDGFVIDQIVLSSGTYLRKSPGLLKNDQTWVPELLQRSPIIQVPAGADLQAALNGARSGDTLVLKSGARYVANIDLPPNDGPEYITITSDANVHRPGNACVAEPARAARHHPVAGRVAGRRGANGRQLLQVRWRRVSRRRRRCQRPRHDEGHRQRRRRDRD